MKDSWMVQIEDKEIIKIQYKDRSIEITQSETKNKNIKI